MPMGIQLGVTPTSQALGEGLSYGISPSTISAGGSALGSMTPTLMDKLANLPSDAWDYTKSHPLQVLSTGLSGYQALTPKMTPIQPSAGTISKGSGKIEYVPVLTTEVPKQKYPHSLLLG